MARPRRRGRRAAAARRRLELQIRRRRFWARAPAGQPASARSRTASTSCSRSGTLGQPAPRGRARPATTGPWPTPAGCTFPFLDSDVYKWLEAVGWELGRGADADLAAAADEAIAVVAAAQRPDGYLNSYVQVVGGGSAATATWPGGTSSTASAISSRPRWPGIARSATTGCSTVAIRRGRPDRPGVRARRDATASTDTPRSRWRSSSCPGSPASGATSTLAGPDARAARARAARATAGSARSTGRTTSPSGRRPTVAGHAVRQLYLDCGAVDVAVETGDQELLAAVQRRWDDMVRDPDLPDRRAWAAGTATRRSATRSSCRPTAPTPRPARRSRASCSPGGCCSPPASRGYADAIERAMYNGVLSGLSPDRNPSSSTSIRCSAGPTAPRAGQRRRQRARRGIPCACCPPNLMRLLSSWQQYLATSRRRRRADPPVRSDTRRSTAGRRRARSTRAAGGRDRLSVARAGHRPHRPDAGRAVDAVAARAAVVPIGDHHRRPASPRRPSATPGTTRTVRQWAAGRHGRPGPRPRRSGSPSPTRASMLCAAASPSSAGRSSTASRSADLPPGVELEDLQLGSGAGQPVSSRATRRRRSRIIGVCGAGGSIAAAGPAPRLIGQRAIPYYAWANRRVDAMRVWIPTLTPADTGVSDRPVRSSRWSLE